MIRNILLNISWLTLANLLVKPLWFAFITLLCARILQAEGYGLLTASLSISVLASLLTDLGTTRYTVRQVSRNRDEASLYFSNFILLRIAISVPAFFLMLWSGSFLYQSSDMLLAVCFAGIYTLTLNVTNFCRGFFQAFEKLHYEGISVVVEKVLVVACGTVLLLYTQTVHWTLAGMMIGMLLATAINITWISRQFARLRIRLLDRQFIKKHLLLALPLGLAGMFAVVYYRTDSVMITAFLGDAPTGQYGIAFRVMDALNMIPTVIVLATLFPRLSSLWHQKQTDAFFRILRLGLLGLSGLSISIALGLTVFTKEVIQLLAPSDSFLPAIGALKILAWTHPLSCIP